MSTRQLQKHACRKWGRSSDRQDRYYTFEYYWLGNARIYNLPTRVPPVKQRVH